jgi:hypothetical protein
VLGVIVLVGWAFDIPLLRSILRGTVEISEMINMLNYNAYVDSGKSAADRDVKRNHQRQFSPRHGANPDQ